MSIKIKALTPELINDYFDFFDNRAFSDDSPFYPCYCNAFNMSLEQIKTQLIGEPVNKSETYAIPLSVTLVYLLATILV